MLVRMLARRLLVLTAVLLLLMTVAAALAPQPEVAQPEASPPALPAGRTVEATISTEDANARVPVRRGDTLTLEVEGDALDAVLLERLDRIDAIESTTPARFNMLVEAPAGIYPIRLLDADRRIGMIEISD